MDVWVAAVCVSIGILYVFVCGMWVVIVHFLYLLDIIAGYYSY